MQCVSQGMKSGYTMALESHATVCKPEQPHPQYPHNAGPLRGSMEQPQQQGLLQPLAPSHSTPAQGFMQQPSQHTGPHTPAVPQHHGSLPPQPSHGGWGVTPAAPCHSNNPLQPLCDQGRGMPVQACPGLAPAAPKLSAVRPPTLPAPSALQQAEDEEVCCAQPALPSALPLPQQQQQQEATRDMGLPIPGRAPGGGISTVLPADRSSSSDTVSAKADQAGPADQPAWQGSMQRAPGTDPPARVQPQNAGQGRLRGSDTSTAPDKENAGAGETGHNSLA